ncbi:MAG: hypothetical protein VZQ98_16945 [Bacteroidales bacterium]|nr:hypothetical protein [Bacteroidales bacterium]
MYLCSLKSTSIKMNKKTKFLASMIALLIVATMFSSCATTYTASGTNVSKIDELAFIEPRSLMYYFSPESGYLDSSLVVGSEQLITEIITSNRYPFTDPVAADYEGKGASIANWIDRFSDLESSDIPRLKVPKALTDLIKSTGHRYGIVVHAYGYIKSNELYDQEKLEELVGNIIRTVFDEPKRYTAGDQAGNALYTAVIDTQTDRVIYFNSVLSNADHPLSRRNVGSQMKSLLKKFD